MRRSNLITSTRLQGYCQSFSSNLWSTHTHFFSILFIRFKKMKHWPSSRKPQFNESVKLTHENRQKFSKKFILSIDLTDNYEIEYDQMSTVTLSFLLKTKLIF